MMSRGQPQVHRQGHQVLLGPVVQVALHPAALRVAAGHDAGPGFTELVRLPPELVQGGLQCRVETDVVERQASLAGQLGEHPLVLLGEGVRVAGTLHHEQPEQFAGVADRRDPQLGMFPAGQQRGEPDRGPGAAGHPGPGDHGALPLPDDQRPAPGIRHRDGPLQHLPAPGVHLGAGQGHRLAQRLGQLQQQLVHGHRPRQPAAERAEHLVGRFPGPVDEPGGRGHQPVPGRQVADRGHRGGEHGQAEHLPVRVAAGLLAEPEHDDQVDTGDHRRVNPASESRCTSSRPACGPSWGRSRRPARAGTATVAPAATAATAPGQPTSRCSTRSPGQRPPPAPGRRRATASAPGPGRRAAGNAAARRAAAPADRHGPDHRGRGRRDVTSGARPGRPRRPARPGRPRPRPPAGPAPRSRPSGSGQHEDGPWRRSPAPRRWWPRPGTAHAGRAAPCWPAGPR